MPWDLIFDTSRTNEAEWKQFLARVVERIEKGNIEFTEDAVFGMATLKLGALDAGNR